MPHHTIRQQDFSSPKVHEDGPGGDTAAASRGDGHESEQLRRHAHVVWLVRMTARATLSYVPAPPAPPPLRPQFSFVPSLLAAGSLN